MALPPRSSQSLNQKIPQAAQRTELEAGKVHDRCGAGFVTVTPGVKIGKANLICAGSVVTKSTEDYAIMAGVPAKKVGYIIPETGEYVWNSKKQKGDS